MVNVYYASLKELPPGPEGGVQLLSAVRRAQFFMLRNEAARRRCLAGGLLLRRVVGTGEESYTAFGKPFIPGAPPYSISHTGDIVCIAVGEKPLGVDLETHRPAKVNKLISHCFAAGERALVQTEKDFFDLWTAKESLGKQMGVGIARILRVPLLEKTKAGLICPSLPELRFYQSNYFAGCSFTLCTEEDWDGVIRRVKLREL